MIFRRAVPWVATLALCVALVSPAHAVVYQIDGTVVPVGAALQAFLNPIEGVPPCPTCIDAVVDASTVPEIFLPDIFSTVRFENVGEGAGFENTFGWYNTDDPATLYEVFACSDEPGDVVMVDFAVEAAMGNYNGGFIGFYIITPEDRDTIGCPQNCGDFIPAACFGHIYYTERALNNDGDFVHSLSYTSKLVADRFYFGFEDLFRGGDNDFEDMLIQVEGLIPPCVPTPEVCDGLDNDCDGVCDEGPTADSGGSCGTSSVGECQLGTLQCDNVMMACGVSPGLTCVGSIDSVSEVCDLLDNDCDGVPDNNPIDIGTICGSSTGECTQGAEDCVAGALVCVSGIGPVPEVCDGLDNDCDGVCDNLPVTGAGASCGVSSVGLCQLGTLQCDNTAMACGMPQGLVCMGNIDPAPELCDGLDNDCDGTADDSPIDIGGPCGNTTGECTAGAFDCQMGALVCVGGISPVPEICDGLDNDCDGTDDNNPTDVGLPCGPSLGECVPGSTICSMGMPACSGGVGPVPELCDNLDNDCDGLVDNNPVDVGTPCGATVGECTEGTLVCSGGIPTCIGGTGPTPELCDTLDNDCNTLVDDNPVDEGGPCGTDTGECELGMIVCMTGVPTCSGGVGPVPELCDNLDNDCDGASDDGNPEGGGPCGDVGVCDGTDPACPCTPGTEVCFDGMLICTGGQGPEPEICDGIDNDCNGIVDDGVMCPKPTMCIDGGCREPCAALEFACPGGQTCVKGYCVPDLCGAMVCPEGEVCIANECQDPCADVKCMDGYRCVSGYCVEDNCYVVGCGTGELCWNAECVSQPCAGVKCGAGEACRDGTCVAACIDVICAAPNHCVDGECVADSCFDVTCDQGELCVYGECVTDLCVNIICSGGRICSEGTCVDDICNVTACPVGGECNDGQCVPISTADRSIYLGGGPSGCSCHLAGTGGSIPTRGGAVFLVGLLLALIPLRRRRGTVATKRSSASAPAAANLTAAAVVIAFALAGCVVDPYTFEGSGSGTDSGVFPKCSPTNFSVEICDEIDNDCDGEVDEGYDLQADPENCGSCDNECSLPGAITQCLDADCELVSCAVGFHDLDDDPANGCEYECLETTGGVEDCDFVDNDCDGDVDEDTDFQNDPDNCGFCGVECVIPHATASCMNAGCVPGACDPDYYDADMDPTNGCEYGCVETNGGVEICDLIDNDCDGVPDDGIDTMMDPTNCGVCTRVCSFSNAGALCMMGICAIGPCDPGFLNTDGIDANGCEYACTVTGPELCNGTDDDCNGLVDDSPIDAGTPCGNGTGECTPGAEVCSGAMLVCVGQLGPFIEICDGLDNDCNGIDDDGLTGLGAPCGTNVGECQVGTVDCVTGALTCVGETGPGMEICNGLDDDCDGITDDGVPGVGGACGNGMGECTQGTDQCVGGMITCVGGIGPVLEVCDGLDNDCNGIDDDGILGLGAPCGSNVGECQAGVEDCVMGAIACVGEMTPMPEVCDGDDDNCDGVDDNGIPGLGGPCGSDVGECVSGIEQCVAGSVICVGEVPPATELCDGLDNDCDGFGDPAACLTLLGADVRIDVGSAVGRNSIQPAIAASGANVFLTWLDHRNSVADSDIYYRRSTDGGLTFGGELRLDVGNDDSVQPLIGADLPYVYVPFLEFETGSDRDVYFARSTNSGAGFGGEFLIDSTPDPDVDALRTDLAFDGTGNVWVVYEDFRGGGTTRNVYLVSSTNWGASFPNEVRVNQSPAENAAFGTEARLAVTPSGRIVVVWRDLRSGAADIYLNYSDDGGLTMLGADIRLDTDLAGGSASNRPRIAADELGNVFVVWQDLRNGVTSDIFYSASADEGSTWLAVDVQLDASLPGSDSFTPEVDAFGGFVNVVWQDFIGGAPDIYVSTSSDFGMSFAPPFRVDVDQPSPGISFEPVIAADGSGTVCVAWLDNRNGETDVYLNFSLDDGVTFQPVDMRVDTGDAPGAFESRELRLAMSGSADCYMVWRDTRLNGIQSHIYFNAAIP